MKTKKLGTQVKKKGAIVRTTRKVGRPTAFTPELGTLICEKIASGMSVRAIGRAPKMPDAATIFRWVLTNSEFCEQYEKARAIQAENMFEEIVEISDGAEQVVKSGAEKKSSAYAQTQRLRVDSRKWYLSKVLPKKYGDRQTVTTEDKEGNTMPIGGNVITFAKQDGQDSQSDS